MQLFSLIALSLGLLVSHASAVGWYTLTWTAPKNAQITGFSVNMVTPTLKQAGAYYLWPGLQDVANSGVYQAVLDGRKGSWALAAGWYGNNPTLPWGSGFSVPAGAMIQTIFDSGVPAVGQWSTTLNDASSHVVDAFPIGNKNFNKAVLAIELYDVTWDFGQLVWENLSIVMSGTKDTTWCTNAPVNLNSATSYTMAKPIATVLDNNVVTCTISQVTMTGPK